MVRNGRDLKAAMAYAVAAASLGALAPAHSAVGIALLPLALVVPGYSVARAIEGARGFDAIELGVLTVIFSFATAVLGGLYLNGLPGGLQEHSWSVLFVIVTVVAGSVALLRRTTGTAIAAPLGRLKLSRQGATTLVVACLVVAVAAVIAVRSQSRLDSKPTVGLSVSAQRAHGRVTRAAVTVSNVHGAATTYRLVLRVPGQPVRRLSLRVGRGGRRTLSFAIHPAARSVRADLLRADSPVPIRKVVLR